MAAAMAAETGFHENHEVHLSEAHLDFVHRGLSRQKPGLQERDLIGSGSGLAVWICGLTRRLRGGGIVEEQPQLLASVVGQPECDNRSR